MLKMVVGEEEEEDIEISKPEKFEHRSHIGWDPEAGFEIKNIPPGKLFLLLFGSYKKSGVNYFKLLA